MTLVSYPHYILHDPSHTIKGSCGHIERRTLVFSQSSVYLWSEYAHALSLSWSYRAKSGPDRINTNNVSRSHRVGVMNILYIWSPCKRALVLSTSQPIRPVIVLGYFSVPGGILHPRDSFSVTHSTKIRHQRTSTWFRDSMSFSPGRSNPLRYCHVCATIFDQFFDTGESLDVRNLMYQWSIAQAVIQHVLSARGTMQVWTLYVAYDPRIKPENLINQERFVKQLSALLSLKASSFCLKSAWKAFSQLV